LLEDQDVLHAVFAGNPKEVEPWTFIESGSPHHPTTISPWRLSPISHHTLSGINLLIGLANPWISGSSLYNFRANTTHVFEIQPFIAFL